MVLAGLAIIFSLGALILWCIYTYNKFREKQSMIDFWWDEVDTHLQLRRDLIPSLIDRARPLMSSESSILDSITKIREGIIREAIAANSLVIELNAERMENGLSAEMRSLSEAFRRQKEVQMNPGLLTAMGELASIEGRAVNACSEYNKLTTDYNASIKSFPANLVAGLLQFSPIERRIFGDWDD
jgi:LemA protein